jgi:hypothetical protein
VSREPIVNLSLQAYYNAEESRPFTAIARFILEDSDQGSHPLTTATVYSDGNEYSVEAHTWLRDAHVRPDFLTIEPNSIKFDGKGITFSARVNIDDIEMGAEPLSETMIRMLISEAKKLQ